MKTTFIKVIFAMVLLLPLLFSKPENGKRITIDFPTVYNGDEPHYLLMISSIVYDGDLNLKNNYLAVQKGDLQAGKRFAGRSLQHQTFWYVDGKYRGWWDIFDDQWFPQASGTPLPLIRDTLAAARTANLPEYGAHPPGLAIMMAPALAIFKNSKIFEPMAIVMTGLMVALAMFFFSSLLRAYTDSENVRTFLPAIVFLGSPVWFYARTLYSEGALTLLVVAAYALYLQGKKAFLPGLLIGVGVLLKPVFAITAIPLLANLVVNKRTADALWFSSALLAGIVALFIIDFQMTGSFLRPMQPFIMGCTLSGAWGLLIDANHGLISFCPIILAALFFWPAFISRHGAKARIPAFGALLYCMVMASFANWRGGDCFGPRLIVPVIPFMLLPLLMAFRAPVRFKTAAIAVLLLLSVFINASGAYMSWKFINRNPLTALSVKLKNMPISPLK